MQEKYKWQKRKTYEVKQEKPSKLQSTVSPAVKDAEL